MSDKKKAAEENDLLRKLLEGEKVTERVTIKGYTFTIQYPTARVLRNIQVLLASRFPGTNLNHLPDNVRLNYEAYATLDVVVTDGPKWWENLESFEDYPDEDLIAELYRGYLQFYNRVQEEIGGPRPSEEGEESPTGSSEETVGGASLSGITYRPEDEGTNG